LTLQEWEEIRLDGIQVCSASQLASCSLEQQ